MDAYENRVYTLEEVAEKKPKLESIIGRLKKERDQLQAKLAAQKRNGEAVRRVLNFAMALGPNVERATQNFDVRAGLMEDLDVSASLVWEDGEPVVYARCVVGEERFGRTNAPCPLDRARSGGSRRLASAEPQFH